MEIKNKRNIEIIFVFLFIAISISLFFKCKYGYTTMDEAFYPAIAYRFIQGDKILYEEWNNTQLCALLIIPFLKAYLLIAKTTDGIYLYIRVMYTILKIILAIVIYFRLKKFDKLGAYISSLIFLIYAGYGLMVLSYNSFSIGGAVLFTLFLLNEDDNLKAKIFWIFAGLFLSVSVLAIPYMALLYVAYILGVVIVSKLKKRKIINKTIENCYSYKALLYVTIGVGVAVILFLIYVFSNTALNQILQTLPHIISGDPAHPLKTLYGFTLEFLARIATNNKDYYLLIIYVSLLILLALSFINAKNKKIYEILIIVLNIILLITYIFIGKYINFVIFVPNILALLLKFTSGNEKTNSLFWVICVIGLFASYAEFLASNTGFYGISNASSIATVGSVVIIVSILKEEKNKINVFLMSSFLFIVFISVAYYRINYVFWENGNATSLTYEIKEGTCKGLLTSKPYYDTYMDSYNDTKEIREMSSDTKVLYLGEYALWLSGDQRCASYSPLNYSISTSDLLFEYYDEHKDKIADVIYINKDTYKDIKESILSVYEYKCKEVDSGWILTK